MNDNLCVICYTNNSKYYTIPCLHLVYCHNCIEEININLKICPLCRSPISNLEKKNKIDDTINDNISKLLLKDIKTKYINDKFIKQLNQDITEKIISSDKIKNIMLSNLPEYIVKIFKDEIENNIKNIIKNINIKEIIDNTCKEHIKKHTNNILKYSTLHYNNTLIKMPDMLQDEDTQNIITYEVKNNLLLNN